MDTLKIETIIEIDGIAINVEITLEKGIPSYCSVKPDDGGTYFLVDEVLGTSVNEILDSIDPKIGWVLGVAVVTTTNLAGALSEPNCTKALIKE